MVEGLMDREYKIEKENGRIVLSRLVEGMYYPVILFMDFYSFNEWAKVEYEECESHIKLNEVILEFMESEFKEPEGAIFDFIKTVNTNGIGDFRSGSA